MTDISISDPEYDKLKLQSLEDRIDDVAKKAAELAPELQKIFEKHTSEEVLTGDRAKIQTTPYLNDYYVLVQVRTSPR